MESRKWRVDTCGQGTRTGEAREGGGGGGGGGGGEVSCTYCMALMRGLDKWVVTPSRGR